MFPLLRLTSFNVRTDESLETATRKLQKLCDPAPDSNQETHIGPPGMCFGATTRENTVTLWRKTGRPWRWLVPKCRVRLNAKDGRVILAVRRKSLSLPRVGQLGCSGVLLLCSLIAMQIVRTATAETQRDIAQIPFLALLFPLFFLGMSIALLLSHWIGSYIGHKDMVALLKYLKTFENASVE